MNLHPINELSSAVLCERLSQQQRDSFTNDPKGAILSTFNLQVEGDISVVLNTTEEMHLALPYYDGLETAEMRALTDEELELVTGGEVVVVGGVIASAITAGVVIGTVGVVSAVGGAVIGLAAFAALATSERIIDDINNPKAK